jgi:hypothetical protein
MDLIDEQEADSSEETVTNFLAICSMGTPKSFLQKEYSGIAADERASEAPQRMATIQTGSHSARAGDE